MGQFGADALYRALGCKLLSAPASDLPTAVLKDVATSDTLLLVRPPLELSMTPRLSHQQLACAQSAPLVPSTDSPVPSACPRATLACCASAATERLSRPIRLPP